MFEAYGSYDAVGLAELVRKREVSAEELLEAAIARAEQVRGLGAIAHVMYDHGRAAIDAGLPEGPFRGVPFLLKDVLPLEGAPMSMGSVLLRNMVADKTHVLVQRMLNTGLVVFGRTNMSELGLAPTAENHLFGATRNPWKPSHGSGGSSGGAGAAVAAGVVPMAHGGDGGGSIRIPASVCGTVGLKPSRGRNPMEIFDEPNGCIQHGVLSRTVRDTAVMLDAIAGARTGARFFLPAPDRPYGELINEDPPPLRIAFSMRDFAGRRADPACVRAVERTASICDGLGHHVIEALPEVDGEAFNRAFKSLWISFAGYFFKQAGRLAQDVESIPRFVRPLLLRPRVLRAVSRVPVREVGAPSVGALARRLGSMDDDLSSGDMWLAWTELRRAEVAVARFLTGYDLLLTPVLGQEPWLVGQLDEDAPIDELERQLNAYVGFTPIANSGGFPAISLPLHVSKEGLPVGSQFLAPLGREDRLLQLAAQIERAHPWPLTAP